MSCSLQCYYTFSPLANPCNTQALLPINIYSYQHQQNITSYYRQTSIIHHSSATANKPSHYSHQLLQTNQIIHEILQLNQHDTSSNHSPTTADKLVYLKAVNIFIIFFFIIVIIIFFTAIIILGGCRNEP
uniref:Uncharacterized protein n=1 Tax=Arion vulgaris TaxID=1028688 RepID=A0A0B7A3S6_9EUPU